MSTPPTDLDRIRSAWVALRYFVNVRLPAARARLQASRGRMPF
jgi:hypothetical protein